MTEYIVQGTLKHEGKIYLDGTVFPPPGLVVSEEKIAELRHHGALRLPAEVKPAAAIEEERAHLVAENDTLRERLAALEAQLQATSAPVADKSKKLPAPPTE